MAGGGGMRRYVPHLVGAVLLLLTVQQCTARAEAVGRANEAAYNVTKLKAELLYLAEDTLQLSERLAMVDDSLHRQAVRDSVEIAKLRRSATQNDLELARLRAVEPVHVAELAESFDTLRARINPESLPAYRVLKEAVETRVTGLQGQLGAQAELLSVTRSELGITTWQLERERVARRAADELTNGLRAQLIAQWELINAQAREIDALRDGLGGFSVSIGSTWWLLPAGVVIGMVVAR